MMTMKSSGRERQFVRPKTDDIFPWIPKAIGHMYINYLSGRSRPLMKKCRGWKTDPLTAKALPKAAAAANGEEIDVTQFFSLFLTTK